MTTHRIPLIAQKISELITAAMADGGFPHPAKESIDTVLDEFEVEHGELHQLFEFMYCDAPDPKTTLEEIYFMMKICSINQIMLEAPQ